MRKISIGEGIQRFLPEEVRDRLLEKRDYVLNPESSVDFQANLGFGLSRIHDYRDEFYQSEDGRAWYESRRKTHNSMAITALYIGADCRREFAERERGEARTRAKLRRWGSRWKG